MKLWIAILVLGTVAATSAYAENFVRRVASGRTAHMNTYRAWEPTTCKAVRGIVRVVAKPKNGTLAPRNGLDVPVLRNRMNPMDQRCQGAPVKGFAVDYRSKPGYRGTDEFIIEHTSSAGGRIVDTYTIIVQ